MKQECKECGYWDKTKHRRYKCYGGDCPASKRDNEDIFEKITFVSEEDRIFSKTFNTEIKNICGGSLLRVSRENVISALDKSDKEVEEYKINKKKKLS